MYIHICIYIYAHAYRFPLLRGKLLVSFAEYRLFYRALLQKRPTILSKRGVTLLDELIDLYIYVYRESER